MFILFKLGGDAESGEPFRIVRLVVQGGKGHPRQ